ncbi:MAG: hypothetical protein AABZ08_01405 [Planctomycetota bacterium]
MWPVAMETQMKTPQCKLISFEPPIRMTKDGRDLDGFVYGLVFHSTPLEKVGTPEAAEATETARIEIEASGTVVDNTHDMYCSITDALNRTLFVIARDAMERGNNRVLWNISHPAPQIDILQVTIPTEPFNLIMTGPLMGFHAIR